jgi:hypothetical protein
MSYDAERQDLVGPTDPVLIEVSRHGRLSEIGTGV